MKQSNRILLLCSMEFLVVFLTSPCCGASDVDVRELERKSILYRSENAKRGFVRMRVVDEIHPSQQAEYSYEITFDESRIRQVRRCRLISKPKWGSAEKIVITSNAYIDDPKYIDTAVQMAPAANYKNPREHFGILNPALLGMVRGGASLLQVVDIEDLLNRSNSFTSVSSDRQEGVDTWCIDYQPNSKDGTVFKIWIAPSQGYSVVKIQLRSIQNGKIMEEIVESRLKQYPEQNIWYPERVVTVDTKDGRVFSRQVVLVEEAHFGGQIEENSFTLAGLDLKPARRVVDSTTGKPWAKIWDGQKLVDPSAVTKAPPPPSVRPQPFNRKWLLAIFSVGLLVTSFIYFWRAFRKWRSKSDSES